MEIEEKEMPSVFTMKAKTQFKDLAEGCAEMLRDYLERRLGGKWGKILKYHTSSHWRYSCKHKDIIVLAKTGFHGTLYSATIANKPSTTGISTHPEIAVLRALELFKEKNPKSWKQYQHNIEDLTID